MAFWNRWPYTTLQNLNLDWILTEIKKLREEGLTLVDVRRDIEELSGKVSTNSSNISKLTGTNVYTAKNADTLGGKPPEAYTALNLLVNSDWQVKKNIVNQRGQDIYVGSGIYTIDKWRHWGDSTVGVAINDGYITVGNAISQDVPRNNINTGTQLTIGYKTRSNVISAFPFVVGDLGATVTVGNINITLTNSVLSITINGGEYQWAALYEGAYTAQTLPPFVPRPYVVELAECQQSFVRIPAGSLLYGQISGSGTLAYVIAQIPQKMLRDTPSKTFSGNITIFPASGAPIQSAEITSQRIYGNTVELATLITGGTPNTPFVANTDANIDLFID